MLRTRLSFLPRSSPAHGELGDRHTNKVIKDSLPGLEPRTKSIADDQEHCITSVPYGFRSFDRQWIIPDYRLINRPNPELCNVQTEERVTIRELGRSSDLIRRSVHDVAGVRQGEWRM
jgi:hypothetical protein